MERAEYHFNPVRGEDEVWSAPNRAQEFRSRLSTRGLEVFPRTTGADGIGAEWRFQLRTTSFGRTDGTFELPPASVDVTGERLELDHGVLVEWFVNEQKGLEQGWTVHWRPVGGGELWIGLVLEGDLSVSKTARARECSWTPAVRPSCAAATSSSPPPAT